MKNYFSFTCLLIFLSVYFLNLKSQDIHFSQFGFSPINTNPANVGLFDGDYRGGAIYRSQWFEIPGLPYKTVSLFGDLRYAHPKIGTDRIGVGILFNNDVAGDSRYGTTQFSIPISYIKKVNQDSSLLVSLSVQPGISNTGFQTQYLTFDTQYDGVQYNSALSSQENFTTVNQTKFDLNIGAMSQYAFMPRGFLQIGFSAHHLIKQNVTYFNNPDLKLDSKANFYGQLNYPVTGAVDLNVEILYSRQGKYQELLLGMNARYIFPVKFNQVFFVGAYVRPADAIVPRAGFEFKQWKFSMAYDINTSGFKAATNRRGAFEFGLIYVFKKIVPFIAKKKACPIYM
ncbi:MAG: PorP/SprF family type IX secretion system membrane protein [Bacteroidota bacterium]|jgi:type IX secretion system PorP/SprF family membrane protein